MLDEGEPRFDLSSYLSADRVHEVLGEGGRAFAASLAGSLSGPVIWVQEARARDALCPQGLQAFLAPERVILVRAPDRIGLLQVMEEALRSGAVALVVGELARAPGLTESRRLQLAAGTGRCRGLCVLSGAAETNAAETRWHCASLPGGGRLATLEKNKRGGLGQWQMT